MPRRKRVAAPTPALRELLRNGARRAIDRIPELAGSPLLDGWEAVVAAAEGEPVRVLEGELSHALFALGRRDEARAVDNDPGFYVVDADGSYEREG